jgi:hypothetical protein
VESQGCRSRILAKGLLNNGKIKKGDKKKVRKRNENENKKNM